MHPHEDIQNLYELLDINKNAYSRIRTANEFQQVDLEKRWNRKNFRIARLFLLYINFYHAQPILWLCYNHGNQKYDGTSYDGNWWNQMGGMG